MHYSLYTSNNSVIYCHIPSNNGSQQALTEFSSLCDEEPAEAVVAILNIWTLMYNKLSTVSWIAYPCRLTNTYNASLLDLILLTSYCRPTYSS